MIGYDYTERIPPAALRAAGCSVVFRYLSNPGWPKNLTAAEARELLGAGISIVLNYETSADFMLGGFSAGVSCARSARAQATALGAPADTRIYYSADFDVTAAQIPAVLDFDRGAASVDGSAEVGGYGGLRVALAEDAAGYATWQTTAWSGGKWDPRAVARQTGAQQTVGGVVVDVNQIIDLAALGAWGGPTVGDDMPLTQADVDAVVNGVLAKLPAATAKATYRYGEEAVNQNGTIIPNVPFGHLAHGSHVALNDAAGAVPQMRSQLNDLFHRPSFQAVDVKALAAAIAPQLTAGATADAIAQAVVAHLGITVVAK